MRKSSDYLIGVDEQIQILCQAINRLNPESWDQSEEDRSMRLVSPDGPVPFTNWQIPMLPTSR